ncbi:ABC-2 type transport system permease protein [Nocardioides sp. BE266]|uniref:ABC transporter permease n=1 Tax=Nocardioides sp. BE266 TaxID=2817725 RepID=UPI00285C80C0|nr:ABC transporter permease [Nocardioides sp. BE266]MDR7253349.1 ABC-2 type transport system permease protein [Nocardioides sp. BE266]
MTAQLVHPDVRTAPRPDMLTYARLDLRRQLRDRFGMFFIVGLPTFMFLVFGLGSDEQVGSGNVAMYVMISMASYGAVTATTGVAGSAATEQVMGWGRQLGLTPMRPLAFVAAKAGIAMVVALMPVALIFAIGAATGARGDASDWVLAAVLVWLGSALFAIYGLAVSLAFRGPNATGIASGMIVIMAFLGNVFTPMSGLLLDIGRLTPLYGYAALARFPLTEGHLPMGGRDPLWLPVANVLAWTVIFSLLALWGVRRSRART